MDLRNHGLTEPWTYGTIDLRNYGLSCDVGARAVWGQGSVRAVESRVMAVWGSGRAVLSRVRASAVESDGSVGQSYSVHGGSPE